MAHDLFYWLTNWGDGLIIRGTLIVPMLIAWLNQPRLVSVGRQDPKLCCDYRER